MPRGHLQSERLILHRVGEVVSKKVCVWGWDGGLGSTLPSTVYAVSNDKQPCNQKSEQQMMKAACPSVTLLNFVRSVTSLSFFHVRTAS